jgi:hypothetical protein
MTTNTPHPKTAGAWRRQLRMAQLVFAGAAAVALLALFDATQTGAPGTMPGTDSVRLADSDDDQAQLQQQQDLQQMLQSMQQAQEQNDAAQQQFNQDMQQQQLYENQFNNP